MVGFCLAYDDLSLRYQSKGVWRLAPELEQRPLVHREHEVTSSF
jgi:hypothetical protein